MIDLTEEFFRPLPGRILYYPADLDAPVAGTWGITIPLCPFSADDKNEPATFRPGTGGPMLIQTDVRLDFIALPAGELLGLSRRAFTFPVNPEDGFIDGSVYLLGTHNPVDVTRIDFGEVDGDQIPARFHAYFDFGDEISGLRGRTAVLDTVLRFELGRLGRASSAASGRSASN